MNMRKSSHETIEFNKYLSELAIFVLQVWM